MALYNDIVGAEDIFGGDDADLDALLSGADIVGTRFGADIVGAAAAAAQSTGLAAHPAVQAAVAKVAAAGRKQQMLQTLASKHAAAVVQRGPTKGNEYPLGFGPVVIPGGGTANIITQPQTTFRGRRLVVPSDFAGVILINDLKVGKNSQLSSSGALPARAYTEFAVGMDMKMDTAQISQQISLNVTNISGGNVTFTALIMGTSVE